ncbi:MAG: GNAT family N-acetyltransferase [Rhodospirillales bacterium]
MTDDMTVRWMTPESAVADAPGLLALIQGLAEFEGWAEHVDITEDEIIRRARLPQPAFRAVLATDTHGTAVGMATVYDTVYTHSLRPSLELEMLFVAEPWRARGVGRALITQVIETGKRGGYDKMEWNVLKTNARAQAFYRQFGGDEQAEWQRWGLVFGSS